MVKLIQGPLPDTPIAWSVHPGGGGGGGALVTFEGIARPVEGGQRIEALDYEAYEPMASNLLRRIGEELIASHGLIGLCVEHSVGRIAAGQCSFRLRIASYHRKEALAAMDEFIDRMKRDVPLWKTPVYAPMASR